MDALVTGAGGFLGLYLVEQLVARGDRVRGFCRGSYPALDALGVREGTEHNWCYRRGFFFRLAGLALARWTFGNLPSNDGSIREIRSPSGG